MFGSNPFGQSSPSPFGSQPTFGQTNNATSNPFAPKPFGSTSPFASQTGGSIFGGMSTGVFGAPSSSSLGSTSVFGASSSPAFGTSTPTFGAPTGSGFGNSSSAFGGSSVFGQKQTFGGFGSTNAQSSTFGGSFQQSQPAFGSNLFGSSNPFGAPSQPAFGAASNPAFGGTSTPAFGSTASPTFGSSSGGFGLSNSPFGSSTPAFGSTSTPAFGAASTPAFGAANTSAFGAANTPAFGAASTPAFGATSTPAFGATSTPAFGATSTPAFGSSSIPAFGSTNTSSFGAPSAPSFNFGSSPAFGQSSSAFGSNPFGTTSSFGQQTTSFGAQTTSPNFGGSGFGQSAFGGQRGGSRVVPYSPTPETDGATGAQTAGKLLSISAMPAYKDKSHEELRWEDYQQGDKGGPAPAGQSVSAVTFGSSGFGASSTPAFGQTSANPFSSSTSSNPFASQTPAFSSPGFGSTPTSAFGSSPFGTSNASSPFGSTTAATPPLFGSSTQAFGGNTSSLFNTSSSSAFGSPSIFGPASTQGTTSAFGGGLAFGNTQSSPLFQSSTPSLTQTNSPFGQTSSAFGQTATGFGQSNLFATPSTGFGGGLFSSTSSLISNNSLGFGQTASTPFQSVQPTQNTGGFNFNTFGQPLAAGTSIFGGTPGILGNSAFGQPSGNTQGPVLAQAAQIVNPFGSLPAMPMMSIGRTGTSPSIQYGISSLPVIDKPAPVRISSLLTSRHISRSRIRLPVRKYHPKTDGPKLAFFDDDEETPSTPKADALLVPRENPRALVIRPIDQWPSRTSAEKMKERGNMVHENGKLHQDVNGSTNGHRTKGKAIVTDDSEENGQAKDQVNYVKESQRAEAAHNGVSTEKEDSYITLTGHRAGEAAIVYEHGADIEALMPKLRHSDYYTEPSIQELAAKERAEPGFCRHVKDFVVGRHDCGSIKFLGETDVRRLDLESIIQFNYREVLAYMDETKKPPVGQGLNKPAEVTLLNIKCYDKKTGEQYTEGPKVERYIAMLKKKTEDQGAEFVSYDPVRGEWKFRVRHFSVYKLEDDAEDGVDTHGPIY